MKILLRAKRIAGENKKLHNELNEANNVISQKSALIAKLRSENDKLKKELVEYAKTVRNQSRADLLYNALEACGIIRNKNKVDYHAVNNKLNSQLSYAQRVPEGAYGNNDRLIGGSALSGVLGSIASSGIFGGTT